LFVTVVDPEARGDVVGVSRRLLESVIEDLDGSIPAKEPTEAPTEAPDAMDGAKAPPAPAQDSAIEAILQHTIERIQTAFGARIERVLGAGGGLLVVLDQLDDIAEATARDLSEGVPVALIDPRTLASVQRLGTASPIGETRVLFEGAARTARHPGERLQHQARERRDAAGLLRQQHCPGPALELLLSALLAAAAVRAGQDRAVPASDAALWLYGEALPKGWLDGGQAALIMQAAGLVQTTAAVPDPLLTGLFHEADRFIDTTPGC
jgi:hypothetical protein